MLEGLLGLAELVIVIGLLALLGNGLPTLHSSFIALLVDVAVVTAVTVPLSAILLALMLRLVWRFVRPGWHDEHAPVGWALWFANELQQRFSTVLFALYASLYTRRGETRLDDHSLLGVMTVSPYRPAAGTSWLGTPALDLPRVPDASDPSRTVNPPRRLKLARGAMDLIRLLLPNTIALLIEILEIMVLATLCAHFGLAVAIVAAPVVLIAGGLLATVVTTAMKWLLIGHYRRSEHPLWCSFVWRDELMNAAQEQLADEQLLRFAIGTPVMSLYLRAMGARVGRGVWCETTAVTEHDMITLEDGTAVNRGACLMTHLFHDRLLRIGPTRLEAGATLGPTESSSPTPTSAPGRGC